MTGTRRTIGACGTTVLAAAVALGAAGCAANSSNTASAAPASSASAKVTATAVTSVSPTAATIVSSASSTVAPSPVATTEASAPATGGATPSACTSFAAGHAFLHLASAKENADGTVTVTGQTATMICGGPDDFHYNFGTATVTGHVLASAKIQVLNSALQLTPITPAKFPSYLAGDVNVRVFAYTGPRTAITALSEQFHP
jgi:hypothetical protein